MHDQKELITKARELLKPSPVRIHHVPKWLWRRLNRQFADSYRVAYGPTSGQIDGMSILLYAASMVSKPNLPIWLDHWGSTVPQGEYGSTINKLCFVSEPYDFSSSCATEVDQFCQRLGIEWYLFANSWHYPGRTLRITMYEPQQ
jgi:hypothetical protein